MPLFLLRHLSPSHQQRPVAVPSCVWAERWGLSNSSYIQVRKFQEQFVRCVVHTTPRVFDRERVLFCVYTSQIMSSYNSWIGRRNADWPQTPRKLLFVSPHSRDPAASYQQPSQSCVCLRDDMSLCRLYCSRQNPRWCCHKRASEASCTYFRKNLPFTMKFLILGDFNLPLLQCTIGYRWPFQWCVVPIGTH